MIVKDLARRVVRRLSGKTKTKHDCVERQLLEGRAPVVDSTRQSILFFTQHKCASVYVAKILKRLAMDSHMKRLDFENYFFNHPASEADWNRVFNEAHP